MSPTPGADRLLLCPIEDSYVTRGGEGHSSLLGRSPLGSPPQLPYCGVREWEQGPFHSTGKVRVLSNEVATQEAESLLLVWHRGFLCHWPLRPAVQGQSGQQTPRVDTSC